METIAQSVVQKAMSNLLPFKVTNEHAKAQCPICVSSVLKSSLNDMADGQISCRDCRKHFVYRDMRVKNYAKQSTVKKYEELVKVADEVGRTNGQYPHHVFATFFASLGISGDLRHADVD